MPLYDAGRAVRFCVPGGVGLKNGILPEDAFDRPLAVTDLNTNATAGRELRVVADEFTGPWGITASAVTNQVIVVGYQDDWSAECEGLANLPHLIGDGVNPTVSMGLGHALRKLKIDGDTKTCVSASILGTVAECHLLNGYDGVDGSDSTTVHSCLVENMLNKGAIGTGSSSFLYNFYRDIGDTAIDAGSFGLAACNIAARVGAYGIHLGVGGAALNNTLVDTIDYAVFCSSHSQVIAYNILYECRPSDDISMFYASSFHRANMGNIIWPAGQTMVGNNIGMIYNRYLNPMFEDHGDDKFRPTNPVLGKPAIDTVHPGVGFYGAVAYDVAGGGVTQFPPLHGAAAYGER